MLITSKTPKLDLHNETQAMAEVLINRFIEDNYLLNNSIIIIIHGKSTNILTNKTHEVLKRNVKVINYKLNNWNLGETIVEIRTKGDAINVGKN